MSVLKIAYSLPLVCMPYLSVLPTCFQNLLVLPDKINQDYFVFRYSYEPLIFILIRIYIVKDFLKIEVSFSTPASDTSSIKFFVLITFPLFAIYFSLIYPSTHFSPLNHQNCLLLPLTISPFPGTTATLSLSISACPRCGQEGFHTHCQCQPEQLRPGLHTD